MKYKNIMAMICILCVFSILQGSVFSFAENTSDYIPDSATGEAASPLIKAYSILRTIGTIYGAFSVVVNGLQILAGNSEDASKAYRHILFVLIGVVCLWFIPTAVEFGSGLFGSGWDPHRYA